MVLVSAHPPEEQVLIPHHYLSPSRAGVGEGSSIRTNLVPLPSRGSSSILPSSRARMLVLATTTRLSDQPAERCIPLAGAGGRSLSRDTRAAHQLLATTIHATTIHATTIHATTIHDALAFASSMALVSAHPPVEQMLIPFTLTRGCRRRRLVHPTNRPRVFCWLELEDEA
ncbi:hypothetical protein C8Q76DRAFT_797988 [Earliella scabrosa]|nr:hypothetical protein C8Q76DRAFT_797988 [Earliella scabrosa]